MNRKTLITVAIALIGAAAGTVASACEASYDYPAAFTSTLSRADVRAETLRAIAAGEVQRGEQSVVIEAKGAPLSRAQVVAETLEAIRIGAIARGEHNVFPTEAQLDSIRMAGQRAVAMQTAMR
jgi:Domain of unknown function (DUF4148)